MVTHMAATFWHILKIKHLQWPETEIKWICWNRFWKNSWNHIRWNLFLAGFSHLKPFCNSVVGGGNLKNNILGGNLKNNNNSLHRHHQGPHGNIVHHNFDHGEHDDDALMPKVRILFIHIIEGPIKEFRDFETNSVCRQMINPLDLLKPNT